MLGSLACALLFLLALYFLTEWALPVSPTPALLSQCNVLTGQTGATAPFTSVIQHLSHANIVPTNTTTLAQLPECQYTGYAPSGAIAGSPGVLESDGNVHVSFPGTLFQATTSSLQSVTNHTVGPITTAGNITATVTAVGLAGSPVAVSVAVLTTDADSALAAKTVTALLANTAVAAMFNVTSTGNNVTLTVKTPGPNDSTMNLAFANGTSVGLTNSPTNTASTPGGTAGAFNPDTAYVQFATDSTGKILLFSQKLDTPIIFSAPGAGERVLLDYILGL
jgi:hypothetical protein